MTRASAGSCRDLYHFAFLAVFAVIMWLLAVCQLRKRLVD